MQILYGEVDRFYKHLIINIKRINNSLKRGGDNFKKKIFSKSEITYCERKKNPSAFYAKRFAAKEAFAKALGTGIRKGVSLKDIEVFNDAKGKPSIKLNTKIKNIIKKRFKTIKVNVFLSLSDEKKHSIAFVVIGKK